MRDEEGLFRTVSEPQGFSCFLVYSRALSEWKLGRLNRVGVDGVGVNFFVSLSCLHFAYVLFLLFLFFFASACLPVCFSFLFFCFLAFFFVCFVLGESSVFSCCRLCLILRPQKHAQNLARNVCDRFGPMITAMKITHKFPTCLLPKIPCPFSNFFLAFPSCSPWFVLPRTVPLLHR